MIRTRRWWKLARLIDQLPSSSRFRSAIALDDEVVTEALERQGEKPPDYRPALHDVDLATSLLMDLFDRIGELMNTVVAAAGGTPSRIKPYPRPLTARERVKFAAVMTKHSSLVEEVREAQARWTQLHGSG